MWWGEWAWTRRSRIADGGAGRQHWVAAAAHPQIKHQARDCAHTHPAGALGACVFGDKSALKACSRSIPLDVVCRYMAHGSLRGHLNVVDAS